MGLLILAGYGLHRQWWVPGWVYRERCANYELELARERERGDKWMQRAFANLELVETAADTMTARRVEGVAR